jgi:predicted DNA-binding WGR domain protein
MSVHLHRIDAARNMRRFCRLDIQPDLFGLVLLTKQWGRVGTQGRELAVVALQRQADRKRQRGYQ